MIQEEDLLPTSHVGNLPATEHLVCDDLSDISSVDLEAEKSFTERSGASVDPICSNLDDWDLLNTQAPVPYGPASLDSAKLDLIGGYSGSFIEEWLQLINQKAAVEYWGDTEKRRAAVASLRGEALTWQDEVGNHIADWDDWSRLREDFRMLSKLNLTESQW